MFLKVRYFKDRNYFEILEGLVFGGLDRVKFYIRGKGLFLICNF